MTSKELPEIKLPPLIPMMVRIWRPVQDSWCKCERQWQKRRRTGPIIRKMSYWWKWNCQCRHTQFDQTSRLVHGCNRWRGHLGKHHEFDWRPQLVRHSWTGQR